MSSARITTDAQILRNRHGTLPDPERRHKRRFGYHAGLLLLVLAVGVCIGALL